MKKLFLLVFFFSLLSCSKSIYYAYYEKDINHPSYCTLEITKKKEIIYRASSYEYSSQSYPFDNLYIYIYSDKYATNIDENYYSFVSGGTSDIVYIKNEFKPKFSSFFLFFDYYKPGYSISYFRDGNDTIFSTARNDFEYLKTKGIGFKEHGIKWFPPYMVKVDKIDYTKFKKSVQHMNLKDPRKHK